MKRGYKGAKVVSGEIKLSGEDGRKKIKDMLEEIHICMMTTVGRDGTFDSRPMESPKTSFDGTIWFLCHKDSDKIRELEDDSHVTLLYSDTTTSKYVVIKGKGAVSLDHAKIEELWSPMFSAWFSGGSADPSIAVISVIVSEADIWESNSSKMIRTMQYLAASAGADNKLGVHTTVNLQG